MNRQGYWNSINHKRRLEEEIKGHRAEGKEGAGHMPIPVKFEEVGPKLEAGTYAMQCVRVKEDWIENSQFGDGHVVKITLATTDVVDSTGQAVELEAMASFKFTPAAKLTGWLNALGVSFPPGIEFDLETVPVGHTCLAKVEIEDRGDKGEWNKIADLMAPLKSRSAGPDDEESQGEADGRLASPKQIEFVGRLLSDLGLDYADFAREMNLPDNAAQMRIPDLQRAVDTLQDRKKALATK